MAETCQEEARLKEEEEKKKKKRKAKRRRWRVAQNHQVNGVERMSADSEGRRRRCHAIERKRNGQSIGNEIRRCKT